MTFAAMIFDTVYFLLWKLWDLGEEGAKPASRQILKVDLPGYFSSHGHVHEYALSGLVNTESFSFGINMSDASASHLVRVFLDKVPLSSVNLLDVFEEVIGADIFIDGGEPDAEQDVGT